MHYGTPRKRRELEQGGKMNVWKIMAENFPNRRKEMDLENQKALQTLSKKNSKRSTLRHYIIVKSQRQWKNLESRREVTHHIEAILNYINNPFIIKNHGGQRQWDGVFKTWKKTWSTRNSISGKTILQKMWLKLWYSQINKSWGNLLPDLPYKKIIKGMK